MILNNHRNCFEYKILLYNNEFILEIINSLDDCKSWKNNSYFSKYKKYFKKNYLVNWLSKKCFA